MSRPEGTKNIESPEEDGFFDLRLLRENALKEFGLTEDDYCKSLDEILKKEMSDHVIRKFIYTPTQNAPDKNI